MPAEIFTEIGRVTLLILNVIWPFVAILALVPLFFSTLLFWRQEIFRRSIPWILYELRLPREVRKSPQAMEQVFAALHSLRNFPTDLQGKFYDGEVTRPIALEMVSFGGEIHFYIRIYAKQKNLLQAAFFSYYPDVELVEVNDYIHRLPEDLGDLADKGLEIWGSEILLAREAAYPIKSFKEFESIEEERSFDPISSFIEVLGKAKHGEFVGLQFLIVPGSSRWREEWRGLINELREKGTKKIGGLNGEDQTAPVARTPGETDIIKAVEHNLSKPVFDVLIRVVYISPKTLFYDSYARSGINGAFNQYAALNLNSFKHNTGVFTQTGSWYYPHLFPKIRNKYRKQRMLYNYRTRELPKSTFVGKLLTSHFLNWNFASKTSQINTEYLATLFHPPTYIVLTAPHMKRVESKKAGPPAGLAIFGGEEEIEEFQ